MIVGILLTPEAEEQARIIDAWWRKERPAAPNLFSEELASAFTVLGAAPEAGRRYRHPTVADVRRILLRSTRYHLYYKIYESSVVVLAVWSGVRGSGPELK
ncbi:MAG TPA: type II toxin-antitoxin system RelE/ParE family toxin [Planctomycetota bacterium]|jgi:plasmid stabilization system protein ParE|nr:type II toxin-antitoxin system RelE/ParE family toxin [Planctomycetota bacterium]